MNDKTEGASGGSGAAELRGVLVKRLAVAGVLVAVLLGVLAFFDYLSTPPPPAEPERPVFTEPVPVGPKKEVSHPVTPAETPAQEAAPAAETPAEPPPPPVVSVPPAVVEEAPPAAEKPARAASEPSAPRASPTAPAPQSAAAKPAVVPEGSGAPTRAAPAAAEPQPARVVEPRPNIVPPSRALRLFSGFVLQAGVFSSTKRAEELYAKLALSGIPSTLETRVQVGPFHTREEAEAAQLKLRRLGIETILVPPKGRPR